MLSAFWSICLHLLLLTLNTTLLFGPNTTASATTNVTDHVALLKFKESISNDPNGILDSWNSSTHFCMWHGVTCNPMHHQRVTQLNLGGYHLHGVISPHVGNLSFLEYLDLRNNSFYDVIPPELGRLVQLQKLILVNNSLVEEIPTNLTSCTLLEGLFLSGNNLFGKIPIDIGSLRKLQQIFITSSNLTGPIPPSIGNLSSLIDLNVGSNNLEGNIPQEICRLKNLKIISVGINKLTGKLPSCIYIMSSLTIISVDMNHLSGSLPPNMFHTLPNLQTLFIGGNQMSGPIPTSITNASMLQRFDNTENHFVGQVPNLGKLKDLKLLGLAQNNLGWSECPQNHISISISTNNFGGHLPDSLGNMSTKLNYIYAGENYISGKIPVALGNLINLVLLTLENNQFEGTIPTTFEKFQKMQVLELIGNKLSGEIPDFLGNFSQLFHLGLGHNIFAGNIPPSIGNCPKLQYLDLSHNNLRGTIPLEVFSLSSITNLLDLSQNSLSGSIPEEVGMLTNINTLNFSENHLSGDIPGTIGECISLEYLYLQGLRRLDLSRNRLSGSIPKGLQNIFVLEHLNVSFNMLDGEVPTEGVFGNASEVAVTGNNKLCGGIAKLHLPPCLVNDKKSTKHHNFRFIVVLVNYKGQEFKALVFEYMKNGSLEQWLHPMTGNSRLDLFQRINIIIDVASALHYLHHECEPLIVHCDLKPSNVLLDDELVAHVSDFGLARLISTNTSTSHEQTSTIGIKGSIGYAPPEYGLRSEMSTQGDMYSFGILLLEMLTGRSPTDETLVDENKEKLSNVEKYLVSLFQIGLACSMDSPKERMNIANVIRELNMIKRDLFLLHLHIRLENNIEVPLSHFNIY
uniref:non-specific serine/threonine protein kinase n=1 Tax=Cajanus cajan TaxID=3821 RepID=A0A151T3T0_CAJCA|nr:putative LRR receptor-like serine/threonine-protein kinase At3g47570 family [Cajanus cajan]